MAKVVRKKVQTRVGAELRLWCIEMAMYWPTVHVPATFGQVGSAPNYQQALQTLQNFPAREVDADIIGRAEKILAWVKEARR